MSRNFTDLLRFISMMAVLLIHATGLAEIRFHSAPCSSLNDSLLVILNQLARFCVPLFLFLSGYGLEARENLKPSPSTAQFYRDRLLRIGLPLLFWSLLLSWVLRFPGGHGNPRALLTNITLDVVGVKADYHLYFMAFLFQCYLLFPLIRRAPALGFVIGLLILLPFLQPFNGWLMGMGLKVPDISAKLFVKWVYAFAAGVLVARWGATGTFCPEKVVRSFPFAVTALLISASAVCWDYIHAAFRMPDPGWYNHFTRLSVVLYFFATVWVTMVLSFRFQPSEKFIQRLSLLSGLTFVVYFSHTLILRGLAFLLPAGWELSIFLILLVGSTSLAALLSRLIKPRALRMLIGL